MVYKWRVPSGQATHLLMDGGILNVPREETDDFFENYVSTINLRTKLYVVEQKTQRFRFFIDFDYKDAEKLKDDDVLKFCSIINECIGRPSRCLIARTKPRPVKEGIKTGVHIHWPDIIVDRTEALKLRTTVIIALGEGPWENIIDSSIYAGSGLRMLWSHKKPSGDPYIPWRSLDGQEFSKEPSPQILKLFSIRVEDSEVLKKSEPIHINGIEGFINKYMYGQKNSRVKKIQRHDQNVWYIQTDSKFCENIKRDHKSNHVWFSIMSGRICQRCFDDQCSKFTGQEHNLPPTIVEQLKNVDIMDNTISDFFMDVLPDRPEENVSEVREGGSPVFGSGPGKLESFSEKH